MSQPPDWVISVPATQSVHTVPAALASPIDAPDPSIIVAACQALIAQIPFFQDLLNLALGRGATKGGVIGQLLAGAQLWTNDLAGLSNLLTLPPDITPTALLDDIATPIITTLQDLFGTLATATPDEAMQTFFNQLTTSWSTFPSTLQTDVNNLWSTTASPVAQDTLDTLLSFLTGATVTGGVPTDLTPALTTYAARMLNPAQIPALAASWAGTIDGSNLAGTVAGSLITGALSGASLAASALTAGAIPAGVTMAGSALSSAISAANVPALAAGWGKTIDGSLLAGSVGAGLISGVLGTGNIPTLPPGQIVGPGTFAAGLIPSLPSGWGKTIDGSLLTGAIAGSLISGATPYSSAVNTELVNLENTLISNLGAVGSGYAAAGAAIQTIPFVNVMAPWLESIGHAIQSLSDQITSGLTVGLSATDPVTDTNPANVGAAGTGVVNAVNSVTAIANAHATFISNQAITNPAMWGIDPTGSASFPLSTIASQTPAPTTNATSSNTVMAYIDTPFGGVKQSVAWLGDGTISGTYGIYINVYSVNTTTNQATFAWSSGNIVSAVSGGAVPLWNYANIPAANYINTNQGDKWLAEIEIIGPGTYKVCGINGSWLNNNSALAVGAMGATRSPVTGGYLGSQTATGPANVKNPSWTLTTVTGDNCIIVDLVAFSNTSAITALAATCAGTAMTQKSFIRFDTGATSWSYVAQFELHNTGFAAFAPGAKTIAVTTTGGGTSGTQCGVQGPATSYQNISAVSAATTNTGTTANPTQSATGLTKDSSTIVHSVLSTISTTTFTSPNQNVIANIVGSTVTAANLVQDQLAYAITVPFTGTAIAGNWGGSLFTLTSTQATPLQVPAAPFTPTLSNNVPWLMLCGSAGISQIQTKTTQYTTAGNKTYTIPAQAITNAQAGGHVYIDIAGIGGGAGSGGGYNTGASGPGQLSGGGGAGAWGGITLQLGVDIPLTTTTISVHVGAGGTAGGNSSLQGGNGAATTVTITGYAGGVLSYAGGTAGDGASGWGGLNPDQNVYIDGASPGDYTFNNAPYYGGVQEVYGSAGRNGSSGLLYPVAGSAPGGGAAAGDVGFTGSWAVSGAAGAPGYAALTCYQS
jgi:hypothetical protein